MKGLWNWGVQSAKQAAAKLEEVVAPTLPPQQVFENHWDAVVTFYATTRANDDTDPFGTLPWARGFRPKKQILSFCFSSFPFAAGRNALANSNIMLHLDKMLMLLKARRLISRPRVFADLGFVGCCRRKSKTCNGR